MKKIKLNNKLQLNKETVARLNDEAMRNVNGGEQILWTLLWCKKESDNCLTHDGLSCITNQCSLPGTTCVSHSDLQCGCNDSCLTKC